LIRSEESIRAETAERKMLSRGFGFCEPSGCLGDHVVALAFTIFYNFTATRSAILALSTSVLQQFAVLGVVFIFLRWRGNEVNRGR
jgi:hypothetical protein